MEHISSRLGGKVPPKKETITERGELMQYFMERLNRARKQDGLPLLTMPRMGKVLQVIPTKDLYYLKSVCDQSKDFSKKFWWEINPKKHEEQAATPRQPAPPPRASTTWKRAPRSRG